MDHTPKCYKGCGTRHYSTQPCPAKKKSKVEAVKAVKVAVAAKVSSFAPVVAKKDSVKKKDGRGRKRVHLSNAAKQKAYRDKKRVKP